MPTPAPQTSLTAAGKRRDRHERTGTLDPGCGGPQGAHHPFEVDIESAAPCFVTQFGQRVAPEDSRVGDGVIEAAPFRQRRLRPGLDRLGRSDIHLDDDSGAPGLVHCLQCLLTAVGSPENVPITDRVPASASATAVARRSRSRHR